VISMDMRSMPQARLARGTFPLRAVNRAPSRVAATEPTGLIGRVYRAGGALMEWYRVHGAA
jgi:hypothetical protein